MPRASSGTMLSPERTLNNFSTGFFYEGIKFVSKVIVLRPFRERNFKAEEKMNRKPKISKKIYVANLPLQTSEPELRALFSSAGDVMSVKIVKDRQTSQPKGFAFVEMSTQWEARRTVSMLNRKNFNGKDLLVKEARVSRGFRENW